MLPGNLEAVGIDDPGVSMDREGAGTRISQSYATARGTRARTRTHTPHNNSNETEHMLRAKHSHRIASAGKEGKWNWKSWKGQKVRLRGGQSQRLVRGREKESSF